MSNRFEFSRVDRVRKAMMREVSDIIRREVKDPRLANEVISITDVDVSKDLRHAKIFISVFGAPEVQSEILDIIQEWKPQIRSEIGKRIRMHHTPEIQFALDNSLERGSRITQLLDQISKGEV